MQMGDKLVGILDSGAERTKIQRPCATPLAALRWFC